ncbi:MAG: CAAX prenyl protease-related protein [Verrucomicrobiota bacterium]
MSLPLGSALEQRPALARALPFLLFAALTMGQGLLGEAAPYWIYLLKTIVGALMLWAVRPIIAEMRWEFSWLAVVAGVSVFAVWVALHGLYPQVNRGAVWNPFDQFGDSAMAWFFVAVRIVGSSLVVPPLEEVFYRSFLYRWIARQDFLSVGLGAFVLRPFIVTTLVFGFAHHEWLAGILCAAVYQGLVCWTKRLGDAITAHAITNALLGLWVVTKGDWHFW